jgi:hypothetical protein
MGLVHAAVLVVLALAGAQGKQTKRVKPPAVSAAKTVQAKLSLGRPVQVGTVAIVPIEATLPISRDEYMTLLEAMNAGTVKVVEIQGGGQVNDVEVHNNGDRPILLLAGELLLGGQQDRIVAKDCIVPPHERRKVPVFCVEHGRWNGNPAFQASDTVVVGAVRAAALESKDQSAVWSKVAETNGRAKAAPGTGTIRGTLDDPKIKQGAERLIAQLKKQFQPTGKTVGVIFWMNGEVQTADLFGNPSLFRRNRDKLLRSYAVDAQLASNPKDVPVDSRACARFLADIVAARRGESNRTAMGNSYRIQGGKVTGFESGSGSFDGLSAPKSSGGILMGGAGFNHGTYKPKRGKGGG